MMEILSLQASSFVCLALVIGWLLIALALEVLRGPRLTKDVRSPSQRIMASPETRRLTIAATVLMACVGIYTAWGQAIGIIWRTAALSGLDADVVLASDSLQVRAALVIAGCVATVFIFTDHYRWLWTSVVASIAFGVWAYPQWVMAIALSVYRLVWG